jgi:hypothetical protein
MSGEEQMCLSNKREMACMERSFSLAADPREDPGNVDFREPRRAGCAYWHA